MAYRTANVAPPSRCVLCRACGAPARLSAVEPAFRCARCDREQPSLRDDGDAAVGELAVVASEPGDYDQLEPFAREVGAPLRTKQISLRCDGVVCHVTLYIDSGNARGLELGADTDGFEKVTLTFETRAEVRAKESGLNRELQTGDSTFDELVYVSTDLRDEDIAPTLASPAVRAAILALLEEFARVELSPKGVSARNSRTSTRCYEPERIRRWLGALRIVAGAPRALHQRHDPVSRAHRLALASSLLAVPIGGAAFGSAASAWWTLEPGLPIAGAVAGLVLAMTLQPLLRWSVRGRSDSHVSLAVCRVGVFLGLPLLAPALVLALNAAFDRSPERRDRMRVESLTWDDETETTHATLRGPADLGSLELVFDDEHALVKIGDAAIVSTRAGRLGARWYSDGAYVTTQGGRVILED